MAATETLGPPTWKEALKLPDSPLSIFPADRFFSYTTWMGWWKIGRNPVGPTKDIQLTKARKWFGFGRGILYVCIHENKYNIYIYYIYPSFSFLLSYFLRQEHYSPAMKRFVAVRFANDDYVYKLTSTNINKKPHTHTYNIYIYIYRDKTKKIHLYKNIKYYIQISKHMQTVLIVLDLKSTYLSKKNGDPSSVTTPSAEILSTPVQLLVPLSVALCSKTRLTLKKQWEYRWATKKTLLLSIILAVFKGIPFYGIFFGPYNNG